MNTIFALSSGPPPAAIAVIRISGPEAGDALAALVDRLPEPRRATSARLRTPGGELLDQALVLWLPGPHTATGEHAAELHCHGGRAVIEAILRTLAELPGLRPAHAGEFTRRAFAHGRINLTEAEGLADLLEAETDLQRQSALKLAGGDLSRTVEGWRERVLLASAAIEAVLDFSDEDDVQELPPQFALQVAALQSEIGAWLARPRAEALGEGIKVVIAGPPNAGKSTLFNAMVESEAAIITPIAGTTRDVLSRTVAMSGVPFQFFDTAGVREDASDPVEAIGIERARVATDAADLVLWLGEEGQGPEGAWEIEAQIDRPDHTPKKRPRHQVSAALNMGLDALRADLIESAHMLLPRAGDVALNRRQFDHLAAAHDALNKAALERDMLLIGEGLRQCRRAFDALLGTVSTEAMLDSLFGRFCIGK